jgi:hypothetical protein
MYTLEAILACESTLRGTLVELPGVKPIPLPQGICMIPMTGLLLQELEIRYQGGTKVTRPDYQRFSDSLYPDFERLIKGVDQFARHLSQNGLVAYVEATFTGGVGGHETMMWEKGEIVDGPGHDINAVLRRLGVVRALGRDEFDTLGLGRHRSTRQWMEDSAP